MTELKKIRVREAKLRDIGLFRKLWIKFLEKQVEEGSIIVASKKTMKLYEHLFNVYINGTFEGIVLFVADRGVLMWGDNNSPLDCDGKFITNWGSYITPESDSSIEEALWEHALKWSKDRGFTGILADRYKDSKPLEGFEPISTLMYRALDS